MQHLELKPYIQPGYYRHFKGDIYKIGRVIRHSETLQWLVEYGPEEPEWVRPYDMFFDLVEVNGEQIPRFQFLGEELL